MSLAHIVARYLVSFDAHDEDEGTSLNMVIDTLAKTPLSELNIEYNALSQQKLWNDPLLDAFYDELLSRLMEETTFSISTSWLSIQQWLQKPFVNLQLGIEDMYPIFDPQGNYIKSTDTNTYSFSLLNDAFNDEDEEIVLRILLDPIQTATVEVKDTIRIIGIGSTQLAPSTGGKVIEAPVTTHESGEYRLLKRLYQGAKDRHPIVIDLGAPQLIDQLVDLDKAYRIVSDGGFNIEGNLLLSAEAEEED